MPRLASETYRRGISVLGDALELMRAMEGTNRDQIEAEIADIAGEIKAFAHDGSQGTRALILEETLVFHRHRLGMQEQLRLRFSQLVHLASRCEAALHLTRIQIAGIKAGGLENGVYPVVEALQQTVRRAKEVQEEMQELGY